MFNLFLIDAHLHQMEHEEDGIESYRDFQTARDTPFVIITPLGGNKSGEVLSEMNCQW
jgi:hypothetical protein